MDVPDSSDYWGDIRQHLIENDIPSSDILPISAVTGEGVIDLVRRLRAVLDDLPQTVRALKFLSNCFCFLDCEDSCIPS